MALAYNDQVQHCHVMSTLSRTSYILVAIVSILLALFWLTWKPNLFNRLDDTLGTINKQNDHPIFIGHGKPLGHHRAPLNVDEIDFDSDNESRAVMPSEFFVDYIRPGRAVVFRGLARHTMPAYYDWTDDYLSEKYGHLEMTIEDRKIEDRTKVRALNITFAEFLKIYSSQDIYLVQTAPYAMLDDFHLPGFVSCLDLLNVMSDAVLWMSSGGTKSVLHYDEFDNINCILDGTKQIFLVDKNDASDINVSDSRGAYCDVDVDRVDMYRYPALRDIRWYNVTLNKGDCIFIPYKWFHQVRSYSNRNLALNIWFVHLYWIDLESCPKSAADSIPFGKLDFCTASDCLRAEFIGLGNGTDPVGRDFFRDVYGQFAADDSASFQLDSLFQVLDSNEDGFLSLEELYMPNATVFLSFFPKFTKNRL